MTTKTDFLIAAVLVVMFAALTATGLGFLANEPELFGLGTVLFGAGFITGFIALILEEVLALS